ncbi:MAG TPA: hypothetical protein VJ950_09450 [Acidimicrobiia bacterium]|nr:hypothetical protein [Acidimicrobiia bacterium]
MTPDDLFAPGSDANWSPPEALEAPVDSGRPLVLYRGPLQRHRLRLLLSALNQRYGATDVVWLSPLGVHRVPSDGVTWLAQQAGVAALRVVDSRTTRYVDTMMALRRLKLGGRGVVVCLNISTLPYLAAIRSRWSMWMVQGIPEEQGFSRASQRDARAWVTWKVLASSKTPTLTVAVSRRMASYMSSRLPGQNVTVVPNSVSDDALHPPSPTSNPPTLVYMGSGAKWQNLDQLAELWGAASELNPEMRFRVVSNDDRALVLGRNLPAARIESRSGWHPSEVAEALSGAAAGFLLRTSHIVNLVSCPVKFGEYAGASVPVVATDMDWDVADTIRDTGCGLLLSPDLGTRALAGTLLDWLASDEYRRAPQAAFEVGESLSDSAITSKLLELLPNP